MNNLNRCEAIGCKAGSKHIVFLNPGIHGGLTNTQRRTLAHEPQGTATIEFNEF